MDDLDMKQALRRYMESGEPPFPLTASQLISEGKRQGRRRLGLSLGSATAATTLAIVAALTLVPGGTPVLDRQGCDWQLPAANWPIVQPSDEFPGSPPASQVEEEPPASPTGWPSEFGAPPSSAPSGSTSWPSNTVSEPAGSQEATPEPTTEPTFYPASTPPTGPVPGDVDQSRVDAMACYLKREIVHLLPQASFAPPSAPPMQIIREVRQEGTGWEVVYYTGAYVIQGQSQGMIWVMVHLRPADLKPMNGEEISTTPEGHTVYVYRSEFGSEIRLATAHSLVIVDLELHGITVEQGIAFANAPELDLHR